MLYLFAQTQPAVSRIKQLLSEQNDMVIYSIIFFILECLFLCSCLGSFICKVFYVYEALRLKMNCDFFAIVFAVFWYFLLGIMRGFWHLKLNAAAVCGDHWEHLAVLKLTHIVQLNKSVLS